jgi:hypothetical protein
MWELLCRRKPFSPALWMMIGDFNKVMWSFEHFSSQQRPEKQMMDFREVLGHCDLYDVGFNGLPQTYDNKKGWDRNVKVRLDTAVASSNWSAWFLDVRLHHMVTTRSDQCPIFMNVEKDSCSPSPPPTHTIMRYEIMWECEESLPDEIRMA